MLFKKLEPIYMRLNKLFLEIIIFLVKKIIILI